MVSKISFTTTSIAPRAQKKGSNERENGCFIKINTREDRFSLSFSTPIRRTYNREESSANGRLSRLKTYNFLFLRNHNWRSLTLRVVADQRLDINDHLVVNRGHLSVRIRQHPRFTHDAIRSRLDRCACLLLHSTPFRDNAGVPRFLLFSISFVYFQIDFGCRC